MTDATRLVVFSDDWGRHPSSCQHLVKQLLDRYPVTWVNTIGTRLPALNWYTLERGFMKLSGWLRRPEPAASTQPSNPNVLGPLMWPSFRHGWERALNQWFLSRALTRDASGKAAKPVGVTTIPVVADLVGRPPVDQWVYYCVDDLSEWPGLDKSSLEAMERELVRKVDAVIAVSPNLVDRMARMGRSATLLTHGVDVDFWKVEAASAGDGSIHALFWGVVDRRLDLDWLAALDRKAPAGAVSLIGPANEPDPAVDGFASVKRVGPVAFEELPRLAARAKVLVMPYADLPATRAMQPLKFKEYLATGRPVVARALPAVLEWKDACDLCSTAEEFAARVLERAKTGLPPEQARARERLASESWAAKARVFEDVILSVAKGWADR